MNGKKPKKNMISSLVIALLVIVAIGLIGNLNKKDDKSKETNDIIQENDTANKAIKATNEESVKDVVELESVDETTPTPEPTEVVAEPLTEPYQVKLSAGNYTSGVDFPSGKYDLTALSGSGNVYTEDASLNEVMGTEDDGFTIPEYNNAKLEAGTVITITGGLVLNISTEESDVAGLNPRQNELTETVKLSSGNYEAGSDFPAGIYNVVATKGSGNVYTEDANLNEVMGTEDDGYSINEFKNFDFTAGQELTISGVSIELVPSN